MRWLYFDIDGTVLKADRYTPKPALADGRLEEAVRAAGVTQLVCVGRFVNIIHQVHQTMPEFDGPEAIFSICGGAFGDEHWFRSRLSLVADTDRRAAAIDPATDWWYVDDLAAHYFDRVGRGAMFGQHLGGRILVADPAGDGADVIQWLARMPR